jgi:hypothetical protein
MNQSFDTVLGVASPLQEAHIDINADFMLDITERLILINQWSPVNYCLPEYPVRYYRLA